MQEKNGKLKTQNLKGRNRSSETRANRTHPLTAR